MEFHIVTGTEMQNTSKSFTTLLGKLEWIQRHCDNVIMQGKNKTKENKTL